MCDLLNCECDALRELVKLLCAEIDALKEHIIVINSNPALKPRLSHEALLWAAGSADRYVAKEQSLAEVTNG